MKGCLRFWSGCGNTAAALYVDVQGAWRGRIVCCPCNEYVKWRANGWLTAKKDPVENRDLWEKILPYLDEHDMNFYRVKGHVALPTPTTLSAPTLPADGTASLKKVFAKFREWNGTAFSYDDFLHVTEMNNLCDALANRGIDSLR